MIVYVTHYFILKVITRIKILPLHMLCVSDRVLWKRQRLNRVTDVLKISICCIISHAMEVLLKMADLLLVLALWRACMGNSTFGVTEKQIASQTGSFHFLLAPFVVDVICMLRFHIVAFGRDSRGIIQ